MPGAILGAVAVLKFCARKIIPTRLPVGSQCCHPDLWTFGCYMPSMPSGGRSTRRYATHRRSSTHRDLTSSLGLVGDQVNLAEGIPCVVVDGLANWAGWAACPNVHHEIEKQIGGFPHQIEIYIYIIIVIIIIYHNIYRAPRICFHC